MKPKKSKNKIHTINTYFNHLCIEHTLKKIGIVYGYGLLIRLNRQFRSIENPTAA